MAKRKHSDPRAAAGLIIKNPLLVWERSDCYSCDEDRDWILDAVTPFERADEEGCRVFLVLPRWYGTRWYWEYDGQRHYLDSLGEAVLDAERWARGCMRAERKYGPLTFDGSNIYKERQLMAKRDTAERAEERAVRGVVNSKLDTVEKIVKTVYPDAFGMEMYNNPHQLKDANALAKRIRLAIDAAVKKERAKMAPKKGRKQ